MSAIVLPLCGHGLKGFGCGKQIERVEDLFRCVDCKMPFHQYCCVDHFGDGKPHEVEGMGKITSHHMPHHFGLEMGWLASEVLKRDADIELLRAAHNAVVNLMLDTAGVITPEEKFIPWGDLAEDRLKPFHAAVLPFCF